MNSKVDRKQVRRSGQTPVHRKHSRTKTAQRAVESLAARAADETAPAVDLSRIMRADDADLKRSTYADRLSEPDGSLQRMTVSRVDDPAEQEAEAVARHIVAGQSAPVISPRDRTSPQRTVEQPSVDRSADEGQRIPKADRSVDDSADRAMAGRAIDENEVQRDADAETETDVDNPDTETAAQLLESKGTGHPLNPAMQQRLESGMGTDLGDVRVHDDGVAQEAATALHARAFATGSDIFLAEGESEHDVELMAHEATHVVQQAKASGRLTDDAFRTVDDDQPVDRKPHAAAPAAQADVPSGVMDLQGQSTLPVSADMDTYLETQKRKSGQLNVQFGALGKGVARVRKAGRENNVRYIIDSDQRAYVRLNHDLFAEAEETLAPHLEVYTDNKGIIKGSVGLGPKSRSLSNALTKSAELIGLSHFALRGVGKKLTNRIENGHLHIALDSIGITLGEAFGGELSVASVDGRVTTFSGTVTAKIEGLAEGELELNRSEKGVITGTADVKVSLPENFTGSVHIEWDGTAVKGAGKVGYQGEKLSGEVVLTVMDRQDAVQLKRQKEAPDEAPASKNAQKKGKPDYVVFGEGTLNFSFTDWLNGKAQVIVDPLGHVTVIGKIEPQKEFELFPQQDYNRKLFKVEARAAYGVPVVGNIFVFGNVGMDAFANIGPAKLYKIVVEGTYSTDPEQAQDFSIRGSLNMSAVAGLRLRAEAGAGLEVLDHDIKAGAGINGTAAVRGYAEATPVIGYREKKGDEPADRKGEFFIRGDLEVAAQPVLGLSGDLFVELDSPWWSPAPDKKWTWPLGNKEWPIGGSYGLKATVDYVFGSGEPPAVDLQPVEFSADKFLTDMYSNNAKNKSGDPGEKPGKWKEKNSSDASPPGASKGGNAHDGKAAKPAPAKSKVSPGGGKKKGGDTADPNARTADGRSVKELQEDASRRGKQPAGKSPAGANEQSKTDKGESDTAAAKDNLDDLSAAPVKVPRTKRQEELHLEAAGRQLEKIDQGAKDTADVERQLPKVQRRYRLKTLELVPADGNKYEIRAAINPEIKVELHDVPLKGTGLDGMQTHVDLKTATLGGSVVGMEMTADPLGPDHPKGSSPKSGQQSELMDQLITDPCQSSASKFIRGHLLNDNLGGPGLAENMFPLTGNANSQHLHRIEKTVKKWVNDERYWVTYSVKVTGVQQSLNGEDKDPENYVNATFECSAALLDADGNPARTVKADIRSEYKQKHKEENPEIEGTGPLPEVGPEAKDHEILLPKMKSTASRAVESIQRVRAGTSPGNVTQQTLRNMFQTVPPEIRRQQPIVTTHQRRVTFVWPNAVIFSNGTRAALGLNIHSESEEEWDVGSAWIEGIPGVSLGLAANAPAGVASAIERLCREWYDEHFDYDDVDFAADEYLDTHQYKTNDAEQLSQGTTDVNRDGGHFSGAGRLPPDLQAGAERLSGIALDDVEVEYNSSQPAQIGALAYTQGTQIYVAPGQEPYLPHETWHAVQQKQGRVRPTIQARGLAINDAPELEREADVMGARALTMGTPVANDSDTLRSAGAELTPVVQPYAFIQDKQVIEAYVGMEQYPNVMNATIQVPDPNDRQSTVISDLYYRRYDNQQEFEDHTKGDPVDVGLIEHLAMWYRLPFSTGFFVLGEAHNIVGYRRLIEESNQKGDFLGEGGNVPFDYYKQDPNVRDDSALTRSVGAATEHPMESAVAKTAYALAKLREKLKRHLEELKNKSQPVSAPKTRYVESDKWLLEVQTNNRIVKRSQKRPYYEDGDERVMLQPQNAAKEAEYDVTATALKIINNCMEALEPHKGTTLVDDLTASLSKLAKAYQDFQFLTPKQKRTLYWVGLKNATDAARGLAVQEIAQSSIDDGQIEILANAHDSSCPLDTTCTLRDVFMFEAIVDASRRGFLMAGIGDNHLKHLADALTTEGIATISYTDFFNNHAKTAIKSS